MTHETPQPERERQPESGLFNVDSMTDEQIKLMGRSIDATARSLREAEGGSDDAYDRMWEALAADVRNLAERDPERVKNLIDEAARGSDPADRELAAATAPGLLDYDYGFTREALVYLFADEDRMAEAASETARSEMRKLAEGRLTPEQVADYNSRLNFLGLPEL